MKRLPTCDTKKVQSHEAICCVPPNREVKLGLSFKFATAEFAATEVQLERQLRSTQAALAKREASLEQLEAVLDEEQRRWHTHTLDEPDLCSCVDDRYFVT